MKIKINLHYFSKLCRPHKRMVIITFAVLLLFIVLSRYPMLESTFGRVWWNLDDSDYINVADNLRRGNGFNLDFLEYNQVLTKNPSGETIYRYAEYENVGRPYYFSGPMYPLFLAIVFIVSSAQPPSWYIIAALANLIITVFVITAIYFLAQRLFDRNTAILASIAAALMPSLYWYSIRPLPYPLFFLFVILAFITANRTSGAKGWLLVGVLSALAHLTHGSGLVVIATFFFWCIIRRRFKDSLFLMIGYLSLMLPWMIRNHLVLGDFGLGLAIPSKTILGWFGIGYGLNSSAIAVNVVNNFNVLQTLLYIPRELSELYSMWIIVVLLLCLSFVGVLRYKNKKTLVPQLIFFVLSVLSYIYLAFATNNVTVETKYLMSSFLVLLPLSMYGFNSLMSIHFSKLKNRVQTAARVGTILLFLGILVISLVSFNIHIDKDFNKPNAETSAEIQFHEWLRQQNLSRAAVVLTNAPHVLYLRTGLKSLYLDSTSANSTQIEWLIDRYNVDYIAIYNYNFQPLEALLQLERILSSPAITETYSTQSIRFYEVGEYSAEYVPPPGWPELYDADIAILFNGINRATVYDSSQYRNPATLFNNPAWETQGQAHKIILNGINQYAKIPSVNMSGNRTIIVVASPDFAESDIIDGYIFNFFVNASNYISLIKMDKANNNDFWWIHQSDSGGYAKVAKNFNFSQNDIMTFVLTYDDNSNVGIMYLNGVEVGRFTGGGSVVGTGTLYLGCSVGPFSFWKGWIGGVFASLPRAMNASEVAVISEKVATIASSSG